MTQFADEIKTMTEKSETAISEMMEKRQKRSEGVYRVRRHGKDYPEYAYYFSSTGTWIMIGPADATYTDDDFIAVSKEPIGTLCYREDEPEQSAKGRLSRRERIIHNQGIALGIIIGMFLMFVLALVASVIH